MTLQINLQKDDSGTDGFRASSIYDSRIEHGGCLANSATSTQWFRYAERLKEDFQSPFVIEL